MGEECHQRQQAESDDKMKKDRQVAGPFLKTREGEI